MAMGIETGFEPIPGTDRHNRYHCIGATMTETKNHPAVHSTQGEARGRDKALASISRLKHTDT